VTGHLLFSLMIFVPWWSLLFVLAPHKIHPNTYIR
jgi:hypothetical protein